MTSMFVRSVLVLVLLGSVATGQGTWTQVAASGPSARLGHAMSFDSARGRVVLFGGLDGSGNNYGDTWEWDGSTWALVATTGPLPRLFHAMAFDVARGRTVLFGGMNVLGMSYGDTWEWDGSTWLPQFFATGPAVRHGHAMAFDTVRNRTVLFGGAGSAPFSSYLATWEWDGVSWAQVATGGPGRNNFAMAFDAVRAKTVAFGGQSVPGSASLDDTWEWDGSTWMQMSVGGIWPHAGHAMAFDGARVVLFGGFIGGMTSETREWNGSTWSQIASAGPPPRTWHAMSFDVLRGKAVLFGGSLNTAGSYFGDTWEWSRGGIAAAAVFGVGCGSPALTLAPVVTALPRLNTTAQASLANTPSPLVFVALGLSNTLFVSLPLPVTLASLGMPGCFLRQSSEVVGVATIATGPSTASYGFAIPNNVAFIGLHLYLQGYAFAPGANPASIIVSNGLDWQIGY